MERPYEIPEFVIREVIINAITHRDYYSSAGVQVMVFSDRIEVWNPGGLPPGLTIEALKKLHPSVPRNKLIAECFHLSGYIKKAGSGIIKIIKQCKEKGLTEPVFEEKMGCFVVTLEGVPSHGKSVRTVYENRKSWQQLNLTIYKKPRGFWKGYHTHSGNEKPRGFWKKQGGFKGVAGRSYIRSYHTDFGKI